MSLPINHFKFACEYVRCGNAVDAFVKVFGGEGEKRASLSRKANQLVKDPEVDLFITEFKEQLAQSVGVTVQTVTDELEEARQQAKREARGGASAAVQASLGKAKLHGLITDKSEIKTTSNNDIEFQEAGAAARARLKEMMGIYNA